MTYIILYALAPILLIMLLGFIAGKTKIIDNSNVSLLNLFVMDFSLPAALFSATAQTPWQGIVQQAPLILVLTLTMWITYAIIYSLSRRYFHKNAQDAAVLTLTVALPNYAALGLPILGSVLGETPATALSVAVSIACGSVLITPFCLLILEREKAKNAKEDTGSTLTILPRLMWRSVKKPIVWGPLFGVILSALHIPLPNLLLAAIKPLGLSATASALFLTGLILSARHLTLNNLVISAVIGKLLIQPLIAWAIILLFGLQGAITITAILMISLSAGFFGVVFGNRFAVQSPDAEAVLLLSSLLCIITIPLFITLTTGS